MSSVFNFFIGVYVLLSTVVGNGLSTLTHQTIVPTTPLSYNSAELTYPNPDILGESIGNQKIEFNIPAYFNNGINVSGNTAFDGTLSVAGNLTAPNILYALTAGTGIEVGGLDIQRPVITNTGVLSLGGKAGTLTLEAGEGIVIDGLKITNNKSFTITAGSGIGVDGETVSNSDPGSAQSIFKTISVDGQDDIVADSNTDGLTFVNGTGLNITTDPTTKEITLTVDGSATNVSGFSDLGTTVALTTSTDSMGIGTTSPSSKLHVVGSSTLGGTVTLGADSSDILTLNARLANGTSLLPAVDLGSDLGSPTNRFNNIYVGTINSNSVFSSTGQAVFTYEPTNTSYTQSSVLINPTAPPANSSLLGLGQGGNQRVAIDAEGDLTLGYAGGISSPTNAYPLSVYGHNTTQVASIDTSGNGYFAGRVGIGTTTPGAPLTVNHSSVASGAYILQVDGTSNSGGFKRIGNNVEVFGLNGNFANIYAPSQLTLGVTGGSSGNTSTSTIQINTWNYNASSVVTPVFEIAPLINQTSTAGYIALKINPTENTTGSGAKHLIWAGTGGTGKFVVDNSGNVGIGTTAPSSQLHVFSSTSGVGITIGNNPDGGYAANYERSIYFKSSNREDGRLTVKTLSGGGGEMQFHTSVDGNSLSQRMVIDRNGNIGIGTTVPTSKLHLAGAVTGKALAMFDETGNQNIITASASGTTKFSVDRSGNIISAIGSSWMPTSNSTAALNIANFSGVAFVTYDTTNSRVGIGTVPSTKFHVSGAVVGKALSIFDETGNQDILTASASGSTKFVINNSGNVGIGTVSPVAKLDVSGGAISLDFNQALQGKRSDYSSTGTAYDLIKVGSGNNITVGSSSQDTRIHTASSLLFSTAGVDRWYISAAALLPITTNSYDLGTSSTTVRNGYFGTSVISPTIYGGTGASSTLTLAGTNNGSPSSAHIILNGAGQGNVGIGTTSAASLLTVGSGTNFTVDTGGIMRSWGSLLISGRVTAVGSRSLVAERNASGTGGELYVGHTLSADSAARNIGGQLSLDVRPGAFNYSGTGSGGYFNAYIQSTAGFSSTGTINAGEFNFDDLSHNGGLTELNLAKINGVRLQRAGSSISTVRGMYIVGNSSLSNAGTISTLTGLEIGNVSYGATNYAIKTGVGTVSFGDRVGIGSTTPGFPLDVNTTVDSNQSYGYLNPSGVTGTANGTSSYSIRASGRVLASEFNAVSDARLKDVQFELEPQIALDAITQLQPVSYTWKNNPTGQPMLGFLAQDVETVIPNAVSMLSTSNFSDQRELNYNQLFAVAVGGIKELDKRTKALLSNPATTSTTDSELKTKYEALSTKYESMTKDIDTIKTQLEEQKATIDSFTGSVLSASTSALLSTTNENTATFSSILVSDKANINNVGVTGTITAGLLSINGLDENNTASISTLNGSLYLQKFGLAGINILNGKVEIDTTGSIKLAEGNLEIQKGVIKANDSIRGRATLKVSETSIRVDKTWEAAPSTLVLTPSYNTKVWYEDLSKNGFTIKVENSAGVEKDISWLALW